MSWRRRTRSRPVAMHAGPLLPIPTASIFFKICADQQGDIQCAAADYWIKGAHGPRRMTLAEHRGKWLVLFFYPRDFTFICPTELVGFAFSSVLSRNRIWLGLSRRRVYARDARTWLCGRKIPRFSCAGATLLHQWRFK